MGEGAKMGTLTSNDHSTLDSAHRNKRQIICTIPEKTNNQTIVTTYSG